MALAFCISCNIHSALADQTNHIPIKEIIVSIQKEIVDLTNPLEPLHCKQFLTIRKSMSESTAQQIVQLIRQGDLTLTQADIGVLLLSGLKEQTYWVVTEPLLTTNTENDVLDDLLSPPFPYGPGYANTYRIEFIKKRLLQLKEQRLGNTNSISYLNDIIDFTLSGENSKAYADYLKHPDAYGY